MSGSLNLATVPSTYEPVPSNISTATLNELVLFGYVTIQTINGVVNWRSTGKTGTVSIGSGTSTTSGGGGTGNNGSSGSNAIDNDTVGGIAIATILSNLLNVTTGGTLAGPLILHSDPTLPLQAATMEYVDNSVTSAIAGLHYISNAGGTLTGPLYLAGNPTSPYQAATMQYVVSEIATINYLSNNGGTLTGPLILNANPTQPLQAATMQYVQNTATAVANMIFSGGSLTTANFISNAGGTLTGPLILAGNPTTALQAANMGYVGSAITSALSGYLSNSGGTLSGNLILHSDPTLPLQAATMEYVQNTVTAAITAENNLNATIYLNNNGGTLTGPLILAGSPTQSNQAATMGYVLNEIAQINNSLTITTIGTIAAAGTSQATAAAPNYKFNILLNGTGTCAVLPYFEDGVEVSMYNYGTVEMLIYPQIVSSGSHSQIIGAGGTDQPDSLDPGQVGRYRPFNGGLDWVAG